MMFLNYFRFHPWKPVRNTAVTAVSYSDTQNLAGGALVTSGFKPPAVSYTGSQSLTGGALV